MVTKKIKVAEITIEDLIREALSIPNGWKEEIFVDDGEVSFSGPETKNTYTAIDPHVPLAVADLESMSVSDFEGFYEREDGQIERDATGEENAVEGEYYSEAEIISFDDAVDCFCNICDFPDSLLNQTLELIQEAAEKISA